MGMIKATKPLSYRQIRALDLWFHNGRKSKAKAIREAGYGKSIIRQPHKVFGSLAVLKELELRGLNHQGIRQPMQVIDLGERMPEKKPEQIIDFTKIPKEQLQDLKEKLAATPDIPFRYYP